MNSIFYQNDKAGIFKTHKEKYRPSDDELKKLIDLIILDDGMIGIWKGNKYKPSFYIFKNGVAEKEEKGANGVIVSIKVDITVIHSAVATEYRQLA